MKSFKAGNYINQGSYKSFQPSKINRQWILDDMEVISLLGEADRALGRLDMYAEHVPNIGLFISMHILKEANQSSKIEGTQTNIEEVLLDKEDIEEEKREDWDEVQNYIKALNYAIQDIENLPFSSRLIKQVHKVLLQGVRGKHKLPGEFRTSQNWIGGSTLGNASFVPPVHTSLAEYMRDLELFVHNEKYLFPELLKIALIHYQFETIHPFLDGNGRVGRLMITLYLVEKKILKQPTLYLSDYFERHRTSYYEHLTRVREKNAISEWFKFFLQGIIATAEKGISTFSGILELQRQVDVKLQSLKGRSKNAQLVINQLYQHPVITATDVKTLTSLSYPSVYSLLKELEQRGILKEITGAKRSKLYLFKSYVQLFY